MNMEAYKSTDSRLCASNIIAKVVQIQPLNLYHYLNEESCTGIYLILGPSKRRL